MRNFILGCCTGVLVGWIGATVALSGAQTYEPHSVSPYAPGNFMSDTLLQNRLLDLETDSYLRHQQEALDPCRR